MSSAAWQRCQDACPDEQLLEAYRDGPFRRALRLHPRRGDLSPAWQDIEAIPWAERGCFHAADEDPADFLDYHCGTIYPQDAASQLPVALLGPREGECILDACAAPGSKTTDIGLRLDDSGCVLAVDASPARRRVIRETVSRQGLFNVAVTPLSLSELSAYEPLLDAALVDAPCSGHQRRSTRQVTAQAKKQLRILEQAAALVRPGGRLVYSTCTMYFEENEDVIAAFLKAHDEWQDVTPAVSGLRQDTDHGLRLWPSQFGTEPFFACLLQRTGNAAARIPRQTIVQERDLPCAMPKGVAVCSHKQHLLMCNEETAALDLPLQSRGMLLARQHNRQWKMNNWAVQALIERGQEAHVVSYAEALRLWAGESLGAQEGTVYLKTEHGAPLGMSRPGQLRLNLSSRAFRSVQ